jgi:hypothetical protein
MEVATALGSVSALMLPAAIPISISLLNTVTARLRLFGWGSCVLDRTWPES